MSRQLTFTVTVVQTLDKDPQDLGAYLDYCRKRIGDDLAGIGQVTDVAVRNAKVERDFREGLERMTPPDVVADPRFAPWADGLTNLLGKTGLLDEP